MLLSWLRNHRREHLLTEPFPTEWLPYLQKNVVHYRYLNPAEKSRLHDDLRIFVAEKTWEGCGGLRMTDEIKVTIAAQVMLLVLGLEHEYFDRVQSIIVYPHGYEAAGNEVIGVVSEGQGRLGESHYRGPVVLAWDEVLYDGQHPSAGKNLVYHEFAHQLDMLDSVINGTPPLKDEAQRKHWRDVMTAEYNALVEASAHRRATLLDQYGATNEGEFFAVATECYFDRPVQMSQRHPKLYELLREYYRQDPAQRCAGSGC